MDYSILRVLQRWNSGVLVTMDCSLIYDSECFSLVSMSALVTVYTVNGLSSIYLNMVLCNCL